MNLVDEDCKEEKAASLKAIECYGFLFSDNATNIRGPILFNCNIDAITLKKQHCNRRYCLSTAISLK